MRPSFGACAPPSPNLTFSTYVLLRRVGRLSFVSCYLYLFLVSLRPSFGACAPPSPDLTFSTYIFSAEWEDFLLSGSLVLRQKVSELAGAYLSFKLNWGKCRIRDLLLFRFAQNGRKCPPSAELNESKNKKVRALCRIWHK